MQGLFRVLRCWAGHGSWSRVGYSTQDNDGWLWGAGSNLALGSPSRLLYLDQFRLDDLLGFTKSYLVYTVAQDRETEIGLGTLALSFKSSFFPFCAHAYTVNVLDQKQKPSS